ncbi:MAG: hypothetical protein M1836_002828 [Candelina mexicana]|nr:MAG: hypothetical protein M1836_002828 [Candelina mexicana]
MAESFPSTPSRRSAPSSASDGPSPSLLTPRSKVQALLASVDDDSGHDSPPKRHVSSGRIETSRSSPAITRASSLSKKLQDDAGSEGSGIEDNEEVLSRPKGRMAARMLGLGNSRMTVPGTDSSDEDGNAYDRVKQQLMGNVEINGSGTNEGPENQSNPDIESEDHSQKSMVGERRGHLLTAKRSHKLRKSSKSSPPSSPTNTGQASSGLFLSPDAPSKSKGFVTSGLRNDSDSDSDLPASPQKNSRFLALVARKRQERVAQEEAAAQKKAEQGAQLKAASAHRKKPRSQIISDADSDDEDDVGRKLTQQARPSRKASKKALEEMHRETQRMSRNMQLAHEARTRKKITKESLFARFNFRPSAVAGKKVDQRDTPGASSSSAPVSDSEGLHDKGTPPTSPATHAGQSQKHSEPKALHLDPTEVVEMSVENMSNVKEDLPAIEDIIAEPIAKVDKGKGRAIEQEPQSPIIPKKTKKSIFTQPAIRIRPQGQKAITLKSRHDSDSDLEIISELPLPTRQRKLTVFDRLPTQKATNTRSMQTLRALANLTSPGRDVPKTKAAMSPAELQALLQQRARQQAAQERAEKLQDLRDRGIIVQTAEEREKDQAEVEDLVDKARREAESIMQKEKAATKKDRNDNEERGGFDKSSEEDEDWTEDEDEEAPQLSGSDSEEDVADSDENLKHSGLADESDTATDNGGEDEEGDGALNEMNDRPKSLFDTEAAEDDNDDNGEEEEEAVDDGHDDGVDFVSRVGRKQSKVARVLSDDEEEGDDDGHGADDVAQMFRNATPSRLMASGPMLASKPVIPGLAAFDAAPLGLTQMFAGTMADVQSQEIEGVNSPDALDEGQDSLAFLRGLPVPSLPDFHDAMAGDSQDVVGDSQSGVPDKDAQSSQHPSIIPDIDLKYSQSQIHYDTMKDSQQLPVATQYSDFPDPTQDVGFEASSPSLNRFATPPPSTVDTVLLPHADDLVSPIVKRKGRLRRRNEVVAVFSDVEDDQVPAAGSDAKDKQLSTSANVFDVMRKAANKTSGEIDAFDRKKSDAKDMVDDLAVESEDEYAGLGGASDDDSNAEDDEEVRRMINDEGGVKVDESQLAAFYADKERTNDEQQVNKLFKDLINGNLRRKRGAEYELSDSDDDGEARRRHKQREFAKMRKALLEDENIGKIATNPKKAAFLQAIEDRDADEDLSFLSQPSQPSPIPDSQDPPASQSEMGPPSKRKRSLEATSTNDQNRPPPALRRVQRPKKPSNLADIRDSLSSLLEEPNAMPPPLQLPSSSSSEDESTGRQENHEKPLEKPYGPFSHRRRTNPVIDRLSLMRTSSTTTSSTTRLAFHDPSSGPQTTFRVPSLLRRATTQVTNTESNGGTVGTERMAGVNEKESGVKRGGTKKSSVNFWARENERMKGIREGERKREMGRRKVKGMRKGFVAGLLGGGVFE